jgi:isocitrate dehydrogenase
MDLLCLFQEYALFEPGCRHVAQDIMGTGKANPAAMILSSTMMLRHLGLDSIANSIATATFDVLNTRKVRTADMGGVYLLIRLSEALSECNTFFNRHEHHVGLHYGCNPKPLDDECRRVAHT